MASTKEYCDYVLEQLSEVPDVTCHPMMGEIYFIQTEFYLAEFTMIAYLLKLFQKTGSTGCQKPFHMMAQNQCI